MKYVLSPFFKYLWLSIKITLQIILAILLTIFWGIPTLIFAILYTIIVSIWEFKWYFYKCKKYYQTYDDTCYYFLWSNNENKTTYKSYFHCIWNIQSNTPIMVQIIEKLNNKLNLN
jgi:hypothetical protein